MIELLDEPEPKDERIDTMHVRSAPGTAKACVLPSCLPFLLLAFCQLLAASKARV